MITIGSNGQKIAYGIRHYNLDTEEDLAVLKETITNPVGSTCFVISTSKYYMLNSKKEWIEITPFGSAINAGGGGGSDSSDIIYEGGII